MCFKIVVQSLSYSIFGSVFVGTSAWGAEKQPGGRYSEYSTDTQREDRRQ